MPLAPIKDQGLITADFTELLRWRCGVHILLRI
jgi:hypothetical protein